MVAGGAHASHLDSGGQAARELLARHAMKVPRGQLLGAAQNNRKQGHAACTTNSDTRREGEEKETVWGSRFEATVKKGAGPGELSITVVHM